MTRLRRLHFLVAVACLAAPGAAQAQSRPISLWLGAGRVVRQDSVSFSPRNLDAYGAVQLDLPLLPFALRGDVTFGRRTPFAWRAGPFLALRTDDFVSMSAAAGAVLQVPVSPTFPMVFSLGGVSDVLPETQRARRYGVLGRLWWGSRSLNYHRDYGMSVGLWCEIRHFTNEGSTDVVLGVETSTLDAAGEATGDASELVVFPSNVANAQFGVGEGFDDHTLYVAGNPGDVYAVTLEFPGAPIVTVQ